MMIVIIVNVTETGRKWVQNWRKHSRMSSTVLFLIYVFIFFCRGSSDPAPWRCVSHTQKDRVVTTRSRSLVRMVFSIFLKKILHYGKTQAAAVTWQSPISSKNFSPKARQYTPAQPTSCRGHLWCQHRDSIGPSFT